jgi:hypothetical protein
MGENPRKRWASQDGKFAKLVSVLGGALLAAPAAATVEWVSIAVRGGGGISMVMAPSLVRGGDGAVCSRHLGSMYRRR